MQPQLPEASRAARQQLFRALHAASPIERRALALMACGHDLDQTAEVVGCHPQLLRRRLEVLARRVGAA